MLQRARLYMRFSIRTKIILSASTILLFALGANTLIISYVFTREYTHALKARGFVITQNLNSQLDKLLRTGISLENLMGFDEQCKEFVKKYADISYEMVIDLSGKVLFHSDISLHDKQMLDKNKYK
jgi:hypothetical protein